MSMPTPSISVVMPVHNARPFLDQSIASISNQTLGALEFVILDDASSDGSDELLLNWSRKDPRIVVHQSPKRLGPTGSSNLVVSKSRAPIVARMDADDISHPDRLLRQLAIMNRHPEVAAVGTLCDGIDSRGRLVRPRDRWRLVRRSIYAEEVFGNLRPIKPALKDIYREVDRQMGALIETFGAGVTIMVFSLHGMQPCHGVPAFLSPVLCEKGFARLADWNSQSWTERAIALMAAAKRRSPGALKKLYYKTIPATTTQRLARPTMLPAYDWNHTRAFSLPSDQHGWIRINLRGEKPAGLFQ